MSRVGSGLRARRWVCALIAVVCASIGVAVVGEVPANAAVYGSALSYGYKNLDFGCAAPLANKQGGVVAASWNACGSDPCYCNNYWWRLYWDYTTGYYVFHYFPKGADSGRCQDVAYESKAVGAPITIGTCTGHASQQWRFASGATGGVSLVNVNSGLCLWLDANQSLHPAYQQPCGASNEQIQASVDVDFPGTAVHTGSTSGPCVTPKTDLQSALVVTSSANCATDWHLYRDGNGVSFGWMWKQTNLCLDVRDTIPRTAFLDPCSFGPTEILGISVVAPNQTRLVMLDPRYGQYFCGSVADDLSLIFKLCQLDSGSNFVAV